jgi:hypothetical protein
MTFPDWFNSYVSPSNPFSEEHEPDAWKEYNHGVAGEIADTDEYPPENLPDVGEWEDSSGNGGDQ